MKSFLIQSQNIKVNMYKNEANKNKNPQKTNQQNSQRRPTFQEQTLPQQRIHALMHLTRTQSQKSYEGNTIDMVRIVRKNQQARRSRINIDRRQYQKYKQKASNQKHINQMSETDSIDLNRDRLNQKRLSSTFGHQGTEKLNEEINGQINYIQHYIRPSNVNIVPDSYQQPQNKVLGLTIFVVFLLLLMIQILAGSYFLNAARTIFQNLELLLLIDQKYYLIYLYLLRQSNFLVILTVYLFTQCLYHLSIHLIEVKTNGKYRLIDKQTSKFQYIMKCRDIQRNSGNIIGKITKKPHFTIFLIVVATFLYSYGLVVCYYSIEFNFQYTIYFADSLVYLVELMYFVFILPETVKYIFFDKMHIPSSANETRNQFDDSQQGSNKKSDHKSQYFTTPLVSFSLQNWRSKLVLIVLFISIFYSLFSSFWLIVISFAKIQITFKKTKYRMDTFYIEAFTKLTFFLFCVTLLFLREVQLISFDVGYGILLVIVMLITMLLSRILANVFLRVDLYKYFYSQMHIVLGIIVFVFVEIYFISLIASDFIFWTSNMILIGIYSICFLVGVYYEGSHRLTITFDPKQRDAKFVKLIDGRQQKYRSQEKQQAICYYFQ